MQSAGASWKHRVTLTDIAPCKEEDAKEDAVAAYLVSGENACPPEDVGGIDAYADALKSFNDRQSANGWAKTLTRTFLTYAAPAEGWMISSEPLARRGGNSIINEKKKAQENTLLGTSKTLFLLG